MNDRSRGDADRVIAHLRALEPELRKSGIRRMSLFGSLARGDAHMDSDVDLLVTFDPEAHIGLLGLVGLERRISEAIGRKVDLLPEPIERARLSANAERDRRDVF